MRWVAALFAVALLGPLAGSAAATAPPFEPPDTYSTGDLWVLDDGSNSVLRIEADGTVHEEVTEADVTTETGEISAGYADRGIAVAEDGTVYFTDSASDSLLRLGTDGTLEVLADEATLAGATGGTTADARHVTVGADGTVFVIDSGTALLAVDPGDGSVTAVAEAADFPNTFGTSGGLVPDGSGGVWVATEATPDTLYHVDSGGTVTVVQDAHNEVQTVHNDATGGTFTLTFDGATTSDIAFDADAATVQAALEALSNIGSGDVEVRGSGDAGTPWVVEFVGALGLADQLALTADDASLTGGTTTVTTEDDGGAFRDLDAFMTRSPDGMLYLEDDIDDIVYRIDPDDDTAIRAVLVEAEINAVSGSAPDFEGGVALDGDGRFYMATSPSDHLVRFDDGVGEIWVDSADVAAVTGTAPSYPGGIAFEWTLVEAEPEPAPVLPADGYYLFGADSGVFAYGEAGFFGTASVTAPSGELLNAEVVDGTATPSGQGYWMAASDGGVFAFGDAGFHGSLGDLVLNEPIVGIANTPSGSGYWMVASDGGVFTFGDAGFHGSMGGTHLNEPIVGIAPTPSGNGYWLVASDGGVFSFGDASFHGSMGGTPLNQPVLAMAATPSGDGYWQVASDGGVFAFGDAPFHGSMGGTPLNQPITAAASSGTGAGYWMAAEDGGVFTFGDATFFGSAADQSLAQPIVGMGTSPGSS